MVSVSATSDQYFEMLDSGTLGYKRFDIILIDGLHEAEQVSTVTTSLFLSIYVSIYVSIYLSIYQSI